jgi:4-nitrophenyl phosphatase
MDRALTYSKLKIATLLLNNGVPFIGTNPDATFPTPEGLIPGAGSILAALSIASGCTPIIAGKPESLMYEVALNRLQLSSNQVLAIGDRPETDIKGAQKIGCYTALVLSGVTNPDQAVMWKPAPDLIVSDLQALVDLDW